MGSDANASFLSYEDFDPEINWDLKNPSLHIVVINLQGFKREHLKVQIDSSGNLRTSGERQLDGKRWIRFWKDFRVPENCNVKAIRAKFENEKLYVLFPRSVDAEGQKALPPAPGPQKATAEEDKQQKANGKSTVDAKQDLNERKEEKKVKSKEEEKPSGAEEKTTAPEPAAQRPSKEEKVPSKEEDKRNGGEEKSASTAESEQKSDSKSSDAKKTVPPPAPEATSSKAGDGGVEGQGMAGIAMGLTQARKGLMLNVAVAILVFLGLAFYFKYELTKTETE